MAIVSLHSYSSYYICNNQLYNASTRNFDTIRTVCRYGTNTKMSICRKTGSYIKEEFFNKDDFKIFDFNFQNVTPYNHKESVTIYKYVLSEIARVSNIVLGRALYSYGFTKFFNIRESCSLLKSNNYDTVKRMSHDT